MARWEDNEFCLKGNLSKGSYIFKDMIIWGLRDIAVGRALVLHTTDPDSIPESIWYPEPNRSDLKNKDLITL